MEVNGALKLNGVLKLTRLWSKRDIELAEDSWRGRSVKGFWVLVFGINYGLGLRVHSFGFTV